MTCGQRAANDRAVEDGRVLALAHAHGPARPRLLGVRTDHDERLSVRAVHDGPHALGQRARHGLDGRWIAFSGLVLRAGRRRRDVGESEDGEERGSEAER